MFFQISISFFQRCRRNARFFSWAKVAPAKHLCGRSSSPTTSPVIALVSDRPSKSNTHTSGKSVLIFPEITFFFCIQIPRKHGPPSLGLRRSGIVHGELPRVSERSDFQECPSTHICVRRRESRVRKGSPLLPVVSRSAFAKLSERSGDHG